MENRTVSLSAKRDSYGDDENETCLPDTLSSITENTSAGSSEDTGEISTNRNEEKSSDGKEFAKMENMKKKSNLEASEIIGHIENLANSDALEDCVKKLENIDDYRKEGSVEGSRVTQGAFALKRNLDDEKSAKDLSVQGKTEINLTSCKPSTLGEDSRLVKIALPTTSMNIMQSNARFLNKSRNFLNFISEKSTNIMEKTLLPQHIAVRYNSLLKLSDGNYTSDKKYFEGACRGPEYSGTGTVLSSRTEPDFISKSRIVDEDSSIEDTTNKNSQTFADAITGEKTSETESIGVSSDNSNIPISIIDSPLKNGYSVIAEHADSDIIESECVVDSLYESEKNADAVKLPREDMDSLAMESTDNGLLLRHPVYLTLVRDYAKVREEKFILADRVKYLEERNRILESQMSNESLNIKIETLEKSVERLSGELRSANLNQEELGREYAAANKERESMVMKYAISEEQLIDTQRARDYAERRYKEIAEAHELLQKKLRQAQSERTRICNILDAKCRDTTDLQKEIERLKECVNVRDVKLKWTQNKLKSEMEALKETQEKLDKATVKINETKEECEQVRRESRQMIRNFQHSEENKAVTLDQQLKEQQARLILERHVTEDKEMLRIQLQKEVDMLNNRQQALIEENNTLSLKIQDSEKERLAYESKLSELKIVADQRQKEIVDLSVKLSQLETLKLQLIHKEQCLASNEAEVERLRQVNIELETDMDCCRQREAHMLDFTEKLTDKNVRLQSELTSAEAKAVQLEREEGPMRDSIVELKAKVKSLEEKLSYEKNKRSEECEILARHLAEQTQLAKNLSEKLEDSQGEIAVLRRKQQISVMEMCREVQQCRKRLEAYETASPSNSLDPTSRTGSNASLNAGETPNGVASDHSGSGGEPTLRSAELDKQSLIDRILKMQKINVRRAEKLDFLEEHTRTLVAELQKKSKIIQNYILGEKFDAMGSNERDRHKAELARHGGIMASVYNNRVSDDNMTLELSLEINQKLQAVLEDALLKNITLKDNIDTLGEEIARLTIKNQQILQHKGK